MSRTGYPPARSALRLRLALAVFGLLVCGAAAGALLASGVLLGFGIALAVLAAVAATDAVIVTVRMRSRRGGRDGKRRERADSGARR